MIIHYCYNLSYLYCYIILLYYTYLIALHIKTSVILNTKNYTYKKKFPSADTACADDHNHKSILIIRIILIKHYRYSVIILVLFY